MFDFFSKPSSPTQNTPTNPPTATQNPGDNPNQPDPTNLPNDPSKDNPLPQDPKTLDEFKFLLQNKDDPGGSNPVTPVSISTQLLNPEVLDALSNKVDFRSAISEATQQKFSANDPTALFDALGEVSKASFLEAVKTIAPLVDFSANNVRNTTPATVENLIQQAFESRDLSEATKTDTSPVAQFILTTLAKDIKSKHDGASPAQAVSMARNLLSALTAPTGNQPPNSTEAEFDYLDYLTKD